jgi:hypothetical protein
MEFEGYWSRFRQQLSGNYERRDSDASAELAEDVIGSADGISWGHGLAVGLYINKEQSVINLVSGTDEQLILLFRSDGMQSLGMEWLKI